MVFFVLLSGEDKVSVCVCVSGEGEGTFCSTLSSLFSNVTFVFQKKINFKSVIHAFLASDGELARRLGWVMITFAESFVNETLA